MAILLLFGTIILIAGILFLLAPDYCKKLNEDFKRVVNKTTLNLDEKVLRLHVGVGISCILVAGACFLMAYLIMKKHG